jgi:hypothetical protein
VDEDGAAAKHREWLIDAYATATRDFDKAVTFLAGGALGLSITFVHDIAPQPKVKWSLGLAWALFALSLLLILMSFLASQRAIIKMIEGIDIGETVRGKLTDWVNRGAATSLVFGTAFLVIFALYNL